MRLERSQPPLATPTAPEIERRFRFRFVTRGDRSNGFTRLAVRALRWCHPRVRITVVDANDECELTQADVPSADLIHLRPSDDAVSVRFGRGTRKHLFYWRHSPPVMSAVPRDADFAVYMDSDILTMRPLRLGDLAASLQDGRIGVSVDESMMGYIHTLQERTDEISSVLGIVGTGGPLLQAGLIASSSANDGELYERFWQMAEVAAQAGVIEALPFDDMALLTALLTQGGPLWTRWLPLGYEWNYITSEALDPGVFGAGAHYGGHRAKAFVLDRVAQFKATALHEDSWGAVAMPPRDGRRACRRGVISGKRDGDVIVHELTSPFCISWHLPAGAKPEIRMRPASPRPLYLFVDGEYRMRLDLDAAERLEVLDVSDAAHVITLVSPADPGGDSAAFMLWRS